MGNWCVYCLSLVAIIMVSLIGGRGRAFAFPVKTEQPPAGTEAPISHDYHTERHMGKYTGPWWVKYTTTLMAVYVVLAVRHEFWWRLLSSHFNLCSPLLFRVANTMTSFDRVPAVIEYSYLTYTERLLKFVDELTDAEKLAIETNPTDW